MPPFDWLAIFLAVAAGVAANAASGGIRATWSYLPVRKDPVRKSIAATWVGDFKQTSEDGTVVDYQLTLVLEAHRKTISGKGTYKDKSDGTETTVTLKGGFVDARQLVLSYRNADPAKLQHGELILALSNDALEFRGGFVGLGISTNKVISGPVQLRKT